MRHEYDTVRERSIYEMYVIEFVMLGFLPDNKISFHLTPSLSFHRTDSSMSIFHCLGPKFESRRTCVYGTRIGNAILSYHSLRP